MAWDEILNQGIQNFSPQNVALTDLYGAQAKGADIANQRAQISLDYAKQFAAGQQGADQSGVGAPSSETPLDLNTGAARQHVFQNYAPLPDVWTPQELLARKQAILGGIPGAVEGLIADHQARLTSQNSARNKAAQAQYNDLYGVATAPEGQAWEMFKLAEEGTPQGKAEVARLEQQGLTDDDFIRKHAQALAGITHSVAQLPMEYRTDGVAVDKNNGQEIPGYDDAVGVSAKDRTDIVKDAHSPVDIPTQDGGTRKGEKWELDPTVKTAEQWINKTVRVSNNRAPTAANPGPGAAAPAPGTAPAPGAPSPAPAVAAAPPAAMPPPAVRRPVPPPGVPTAGSPPAPGAPPARPPGFGNPNAPSANNAGKPLDFSDIPPGYSTKGRAPGTMGPGESATATGAAEDLRAANKQASLNLGNANYELTEAKQILSILPAAAVGPGSGAAAKLQTALQGVFGNSNFMREALGDPGARQMLEKLLGQGAIASTEKEMKESGGGSIRGGAQLANLAINKLNASPEMARSAIEAIVNYQKQQAQYDRQKWGQDYAAYRVKGGDPNSYGDWYDAKYPLQNVVKPLPVGDATPPSGQTPQYSREQVLQWATTHGRDPAGALRHFGY